MALESSVLGCGSDDWSVDSDYAFQGFADDIKQHQDKQRGEPFPQPLAPTLDRSDAPNSLKPSSADAVASPENNLNTGSTSLLHGPPAKAKEAEATGQMATVAEGEGVASGRMLVLEYGETAREDTKDERLGGGNPPNPLICKTRLFGDPGSSTDSAHILRLEQRMFLKVG